MRELPVIIVAGLLSPVLAGCLTVSQYKFAFDFETGEVRREYYDITSRPGPDEKDYSVEKDWAALKKVVGEEKPEFDPSVVEDLSWEVFAEGNILSGRKLQRVKCPRCFPSKAALLSYLHGKDWRFEIINNEIMLFLPPGKKVISTNGQGVTTANNSLIVWPEKSTRIEYVASEPFAGGTSLLPYYVKEKPDRK